MCRYVCNVGDGRVYKFGGDKYPIAFKIFYGDGSIYESSMGDREELLIDWNNADSEDVQVVVLYENTKMDNKHTKMVYSGFDYYTFDGEMFLFTNVSPRETILYGKWAKDYETFKKIFHKALLTEL